MTHFELTEDGKSDGVSLPRFGCRDTVAFILPSVALSVQVLVPELGCFCSKSLKCGSDFGTGQWTSRRVLGKE